MELLGFAVCYKNNISRRLGALRRSSYSKEVVGSTDAKSLAFSGLHLFILDQLTRGLGKRSAYKYILEVAQFIASKQVRIIRDEAAKEAEERYALRQCAAALVPLQRAIDMGHLPSRALKAWMLSAARGGVAHDSNRAFKLAEEGARLGCHHCQGVMAECYMYGYGIRPDEAQSLELARESSGKGSRYGQHVLGCFYEFGVGGVAQDDVKAVGLYRLAAVQNCDGAQYWLGVAQDCAEALRLYQLGAAIGWPSALYLVAERYEHGYGVLLLGRLWMRAR